MDQAEMANELCESNMDAAVCKSEQQKRDE